jgi:hypothetical protein
MIVFSFSSDVDAMQSVRTARVLKVIRLWRLLRLLRTARFFRVMHGYVAEHAAQNRALPKLGAHSEVLKAMDTSGDGYFHYDELEASLKSHHILAQDGVLKQIFEDILIMVESGGKASKKSGLGENIVQTMQVRQPSVMLPALCEGVFTLLGLIFVVGYHVLFISLFDRGTCTKARRHP